MRTFWRSIVGYCYSRFWQPLRSLGTSELSKNWKDKKIGGLSLRELLLVGFLGVLCQSTFWTLSLEARSGSSAVKTLPSISSNIKLNVKGLPKLKWADFGVDLKEKDCTRRCWRLQGVRVVHAEPGESRGLTIAHIDGLPNAVIALIDGRTFQYVGVSESEVPIVDQVDHQIKKENKSTGEIRY